MAWIAATPFTLESAGTRLQEVASGVGAVSLQILVVTLLLVTGWMLARLAFLIVRWVLERARFDDAVLKTLGTPRWRSGAMPSGVLAWIAQGFVFLFAVLVAGDVAGLELSTSVAQRFAEVLPRVIAATVELVVGLALALFVGALTRRLFETTGVGAGARWRGQVVTFVLSGFAVLLSLEQLGLAAQLILAIGVAATGAIGLAIALAFGLGCRDLARDFVVEYLSSLEEPTERRQ